MESDNTATLILFVFGLPLRYELIHRPDASQMDSLELFGQPEFYLWDNVAIALHVENGQVVMG